jgi:hypothetical protein
MTDQTINTNSNSSTNPSKRRHLLRVDNLNKKLSVFQGDIPQQTNTNTLNITSTKRSTLFLLDLPTEIIVEIIKYNPNNWILVNRSFYNFTQEKTIYKIAFQTRIDKYQCLYNHNKYSDDVWKSLMMYTSIRHGDIEVFRYLVTKSFKKIEEYLLPVWLDEKLRSITDYIPYILHDAAEYHRIETFKSLVIEYNFDVKQQDIINRRPIHVAAKAGCTDIIKYILSIDSNQKHYHDSNGWTPLYFAYYYRKLETAKYLIQCHPESVNSETITGHTVLHLAVQNNDFEMVRKVFTKQNRYTTSKEHGLPMHSVTSIEMIKLLETLGTDINAKDNKGRTLYHFVLSKDSIFVVEYILSRPDVKYKYSNITSISPKMRNLISNYCKSLNT